MNSPSFQRTHAQALLKSGELEQAVACMTRYALSGDVEAMILLANYEFDQGTRERSDGWIKQAEQSLHPEDHDAKVELLSAYQMGLGSEDHEVRDRRALELLGELAESGNLVAAHSLMSHYLYGLNGAEVSREKFAYWARVADSLGSDGATLALKNIERWPNVGL
ncbi:hypothetical protein BSZ31_10770 [Limnobacter sp. SAORIC-690]|jgi:hypothetical protein|uniref:hypothetical protein n=1 Tax=unclassified Limnobacter TaxID=2630203 RepID=UPI000CF4F0A9|nr:hypothetical protein [Limnobacter sp. SAORIC-690]PQJ25377.1 hypothetical protein BSZ31_10770 [Limnobacter sp. SAORIC-690]